MAVRSRKASCWVPMSAYHKSLAPERWRALGLPAQIRATLAYARALELLDLTAATSTRRGLLREILRWRDLVAEEYLEEHKTPETAQVLLRALLLLSAPSARQIPYLCPPSH